MNEDEIREGARRIDIDELIDAAHESMFGTSSIGFCVSCGAGQDGCEPDARAYPCDECGKATVYGAVELLLYARVNDDLPTGLQGGIVRVDGSR